MQAHGVLRATRQRRLFILAALVAALPAAAGARAVRAPLDESAPLGEEDYSSGPRQGVVTTSAAPADLPNPPLRLQSLLSGSWTPEREVFKPDGYNSYAFDAILDSQGRSFIVFSRNDPSRSGQPLVLFWSRNTGSAWTQKTRVSPTDDSMVSKPRLARGSDGRLWLVWANVTLRGIWYAVLDSTQWSTPARVNPSDAWNQYSPVIAEGGGELWCTWYASTAGTNKYDVFVSRWTGSSWSSPENLTYEIPGRHWFVDLAVDSQGQPHLVWGNSDTGGLLYTMRSNSGGWTVPERINNAPTTGWPYCGISLAEVSEIHVFWVTSTEDLAYRRRSSAGSWEPEQVPYSHLGWGVAYPDIRSFDGTVSIVWQEYTGVTEAIYEMEPGDEIHRLDSGTWFYEETPVLLAGPDSLRVFWAVGDPVYSGVTFLSSTRAIAPPVPVQLTFASMRRENDGVVLEWRTSESNPGSFYVDRELPGQPRARISDAVDPIGAAYSCLDASAPPAGTKYYIELLDRAGGTTTFGPYELLDGPGVLSVGARLTASPNPFRAGVKLAARNLPPGDLVIEVCSVAGRVVHREPALTGFAGGDAAFQIAALDALPAGMYFARVRVGTQSVSTKLVKLD